MNEEKQDLSNNNKIQKRPISILLVSLLGGVFLLFLLLSIFAADNHLFYTFLFLTFFTPILFIISLVLLLINKRKNKRRTNYFIISTAVLAVLLIISPVITSLNEDTYAMANINFKQKRYESAIEEYQRVINESEDKDKIIDSENKVQEAEAYIKEAEGYVAKGNDYLSNDQFDEALTEYEKAYEIYPYLSGLKEKISSVRQEKNKQEVAEAEAEKKEKINSTLEEGENLYKNKEYKKSLEKFNEVLGIDSKNKEANEKVQEIENVLSEVETIIASGDSLFKDKQFEEALNKYQDAESLYPYHSEIESKILQTQSKIDEEIKLAEKSEGKFSFDEYIEKSKVREYKIVEEEDISIKALGDKLFSEYTAEEIDRLPINKRMKYSITVPRDITEEELKSTLSQIIKEKSTENLEIDEIVVFAWYFKESVGQTAAMGKAEWCPNGEWGGLSPEIAENDIRDSYKIIFSIDIQIYEDEVKYGLTESERMKAFYDLVELQDSIPIDDPEWAEKNDEAYTIIAKNYGITRDQMFKIGIEGITKGWPMPEL
ncbi:hypothetical protein ES705_01653 [subsurface metagenome]|nr:tetratricopeptide repeat protein [Clostridia bacterium]